MKILVDGKIFELQVKGGVTNYVQSILNRLSLENNLFLTTSDSLKNVHREVSDKVRIVQYKRFSFKPGRLSYWIEQFYFEFYAYTKAVDVIHIPYYLNLFRDRLDKLRIPTVLTIHDLIKEKYPHYFQLSQEEMQYRHHVIKNVSAIVCVSQNTKNDLLCYYPFLDPDKVSVVYLATDIHNHLPKKQDSIRSQKNNQNYFLFVGGRQGYKNFVSCLEALRIIFDEVREIILKVVGSPFSQDEKNIISTLGLQDKIKHCGFLDNSDLAVCYHNSIALIYPSLYEGFGLPPLEAIACGTCVVAFHTSSIPEVVQDAGFLCSEPSVDSLVQNLRNVIVDIDARYRMIERGENVIHKFSWDLSCKQLLNIYQSII